MMKAPHAGDRFVVEEPFQAIVLVHWRAPFTSGNDRVLPKGLEFTVHFDPPSEATGVSALPDDVARWERKLVPEEDRSAGKYGGYSMVISLEDLQSNCSPLPIQ